ncbi:MAG: RNA-binding protein Jag [uncultured Sulfurovum sp.]|uniref:RNA-binding protein Jag n=1 Tax=uncultured Sulfurovum sp. TaxID=269237 RepID=A0A6S6TBL5_9BACT|nr:MAG: RNA-binding protein Jag [uncultured Sulfurovum sp.]
MEMKRIEADTLEEAYSKAAKELSCSVTEINYEIVQHPTSGMMGLFKKTAIIIAVKKVTPATTNEVAEEKPKEVTQPKVEASQNNITKTPKKQEKKIETEVVKEAAPVVENKLDTLMAKDDSIVDGFFNNEANDIKTVAEKQVETKSTSDEEAIIDDRDAPENKELSLEIEQKMQNLMKAGCFEIDTVEVDVFNGIAHIFIDGDDAALLIGKEGYRYNALSYMLFNWINAEYNLYIKLEIAEFIQAQEEMIDNYLKPISEHIKEHGKGKTKPLDGILVQIALEKLRAMFPNKYIAIKTGKDGKKFIIINDFNTRKK